MILSPLGTFTLSHDRSPERVHGPSARGHGAARRHARGAWLRSPRTVLRGTRGGRVTYDIYATNGFSDGLVNNSGDGTRIPRGQENFEDNNGSPALVGRRAWSPALGHELGVSAHHGAYNQFNVEGLQIDRRRNVTIAVVDAETSLLGIRLSREAASIATYF